MSSQQNVTLRLDLALNGQQGLQSALTAMRQQFQQLGASYTAFRNLLNAGPGTQLATQQLGLNALRAELRAAEAGAGARAMHTPLGRQSLARLARAESDFGLGAARQLAAVAGARADYAASNPGRQAAAARAAAAAETRLAEARQKGAALAAEVAHAESGPGKYQAYRLALQEQRQATLAQRAGLLAAEARTGAAQSPAGQQQLREQARLEGRGAAATLRQELARMRARDAYEQSPEGRRRGEELRGLEQEKAEREEARRRRQVIGQYGELGGRMQLFGESLAASLGKVAPAVGVTAAALATFSHALETSATLAAAANPVGAHQVATSAQALQIEAGRTFTPAQRREQAILARLAEEARQDQNPGYFRSLLRDWYTREGVLGGRNLIRAASHLPDRLRNQDQLARENALMNRAQEFAGPFQSRYQSFAQYGESLQLAASNQTRQEAENLQRQLQIYLENQGRILDRIASNTDNLRNFNPAWR